MSFSLDRSPPFGRRSVRLDTLIRLRWLAVAGQTAAVVSVAFGLGFPLPMGWCLALIAVSAWLNLILRLRYPPSRRFTAQVTAVLLAYDILQLAGLLYLTGGLQNPFAFLLIAPVMISATALPPRKTLALGVLVVAVATALVFVHQPLPWWPDETLQMPLLFVAGVWVALTSSLMFMSVYAFRVSEEARQLADALTATELVLAREQHLNALDGMAAAAAHELGTPLATIALVARELERELEPDDPRAEDVHLLSTQSERCRDILRKLTSLGNDPESPLDRMAVTLLLEEIASPHRDFGVAITVERASGVRGEPTVTRNPAVLYGLGNLVENAIDFADTTVDISAEWTDETVVVTVRDDGPGFAVEIIERLGDPYVTTRASHQYGSRDDGDASEAGGLGLGFFIAKTLLERTGASLSLTNRPAPAHGAVVRVAWPRDAIEVERTARPENETARRLGVAAASPGRVETL
jgi:two-component system sensor histidine kinase RegB